MATTDSTFELTTDTPSRSRRWSRPSGGRIVAWLVLWFFILATLLPLYWMLRTAFSTSSALYTDPTSLTPVDFTLGAFKRVLGLSTIEEAHAEGGSGASLSFWLYLRNSTVVATLVTVSPR